MSSNLTLVSAGGAAACSSPTNRPTAALPSPFRLLDTIHTASSTTTLLLKTPMSSSPSPSLAIAALAHPPRRDFCSTSTSVTSRRMRLAQKSSNSAPSLDYGPSISASTSLSSTPITEDEEREEEKVSQKIGARVRVKVPLKVYHVPRVPEVDLTGKEGQLKQYVGLWKGKRISANLPYKVEFVVDVEGRGPVKFLAHLKEDEFEYLD